MKIARALFLLAPLGLAACGDPEFGSDFDGPIEAYFDQDPEQFTEAEYRLVGKVLVLDADARKIDATHDFLPEELKALTPDEVGTIAIITCVVDLAGSYGFFSDGYSLDCEGHLYEAATGKLMAQVSDFGNPPRETSFPFGDKIGKKPAKGLAQRIVDLSGLDLIVR